MNLQDLAALFSIVALVLAALNWAMYKQYELLRRAIDNLTSTIDDLKEEVKESRTDRREMDKRLTIVEQSVKSAHHRLDKVDRDA